MKRFLSGIMLAIAFDAMAAGHAQSALVTFYSEGCRFCTKDFFAAMFAGSAVVPYGGPIFDGKVKLIEAMAPNHFVTIRMQPGLHSFAGEGMGVFSLKRKRAKGRDLQLTLQPGQHYFVSFSTKDTGVSYSFRRLSPMLAGKDCHEASEEAAQTEPLRPRGIGKKRIADVEPSVYFPVCEANGPSNH